jgi:hypothetical protein
VIHINSLVGAVVCVGFVVDETTNVWYWCQAFTTEKQAWEWAEGKAKRKNRDVRRHSPRPRFAGRVESLRIAAPARKTWLEPLLTRLWELSPGVRPRYTRTELVRWVRRFERNRTVRSVEQIVALFQDVGWQSRETGGVR